MLAIFGLLTLVNAPFDWAAIGLTRFLLRRGLSWGGPWPYALAVLDAIAAAFSVALLAVVAVVAVQTFDDIGVLRAGEAGRVLPLGPLFEKLFDNPAETENWWIWLMLFSTAIPSVVNLFIASFAFLRSMPFTTKWILSSMPENAEMRSRDCLRVSAALAVQVAIGAMIMATLLGLMLDNLNSRHPAMARRDHPRFLRESCGLQCARACYEVAAGIRVGRGPSLPQAPHSTGSSPSGPTVASTPVWTSNQ